MKNKLAMNCMNIIYRVGIFCFLCLSAGCSNSDRETVPDDLFVTFDVVHPALARATSTTFEAGDQVGVFLTERDAPLEVSGNYVNNELLTYSGSTWESARNIYWNDGTYDVFGYYPYVSPLTSVDDMPFEVASDQTIEGNENALGAYEASDFLWAKAKAVTAGEGAVKLVFAHRMSKLNVRLVKGDDYEGELPEEAEVYVHNTVPSATIDLSVGVVTRNPYATARTIRAKKTGVQQYSAIVVPQRMDNSKPLVEVVMKGVAYLVESRFVFKPGIQHTITVVISKNPEQVKIEIGGEIENWEE
ncbi:fimbrillin family protein [Butyricimonas synergistica]|uniref:fimbrillin family protein n=1 Tax=Butyricimonas synergistica TaxID=544644 RepID=UPI0022E48F68|nr:fimbrillin family protein [Butyricimonas synergistica]